MFGMTFWNTAFGVTQSAVPPTSKTAVTITSPSQPTPRRLRFPNAPKVPKHRSRSFGSLNISRKIIPASTVTLRTYASPNGQWNSFAVLDERRTQFLIFPHRMRLPIGWIFFAVWQIRNKSGGSVHEYESSTEEHGGAIPNHLQKGEGRNRVNAPTDSAGLTPKSIDVTGQ